MDDGSPGLEVGFTIDSGGSFTELERLRAMMNSSADTALGAAAQVETAFGRVRFGGATAEVTAFGSAATRELQSVARVSAQAEKAGERMIRNLERQTTEFGRTSAEIRNMRVDKLIADLDRVGNTDASGRLRLFNTELNRLEAAGGRAEGAAPAAQWRRSPHRLRTWRPRLLWGPTF